MCRARRSPLQFAVFSLVLALGLASGAAAATPGTLAIEGMLSTAAGGPVTDGNYKVAFALYAAATGGTAAWSEVALAVPVKGGHFHTILGVNKPIDAATLSGLAVAHVGIAVGADPELPRVPLHSVAYALVAGSVACSGCIGGAQLATSAVSASHLDFTWAGSKTKAGPALQAIDLACTACVGYDEIAWVADLDLGGNGLKAKKVAAVDVSATTITAAKFVGDGSGLTGLKVPSGQCQGANELVVGIDADGTLKCKVAVTEGALPKDGLAAISNGTLDNRFVHDNAGAGLPLAILDADPIGISSTIELPDLGPIKTLTVHVQLDSSEIGQLVVTLFDPDSNPIVLFDKSAQGKTLKTSWPAPSKPISGDLAAWIGKSPKGKWRLKVVDSKTDGGKTDGELKAWSVVVQTVSATQVQAKGKLIAAGGIDLASVPVQGLRLENAKAPPVTCDAGHLGYVFVDTEASSLRFCTGKEWLSLHNWGLGESEGSAGASCKDLLAEGAADNGVYWLKHKGSARRTWCNQKLLGGGWTLAFKYSVGNSLTNASSLANQVINGDDLALLGPDKAAKLLSLGMMDLAGASELLAVVYKGGKSVFTIGFKLTPGDLNGSWKKANFIKALSSVDIAGYAESLVTLKMAGCDRNFYVTQVHAGCPGDVGALTVNTGEPLCCAWEKAHTISYWPGPGNSQNYNSSKKDGEVLALFVR